MELLSKKKVCANCYYRYEDHIDVTYDYYRTDKCAFFNKVCSDTFNTTCDHFKEKK